MKKNKNHQYRHGDLFLEKIDSIPPEAIEEKTDILLEGEATGHMHRVDKNAKIFTINDRKYLLVENSTFITHEEHKTIKLPKGIYEVTRQREYDPYEGIRNVLD